MYFTNVQDVTIGVDEAFILGHVCQRLRHERGVPSFYMAPASIDRQLNLLVLRSEGMDKLRALYFPRITFDNFDGRAWAQMQPWITGPIPGGVLETVVAREMMIPLASRAAAPQNQSFAPLTRLPAELRNMIYTEVLVSDGPINPSRQNHQRPSAVARLGRQPRNPPTAPHSCLALLQTSREIHNEATGIFYGQNDFVFYTSAQLVKFLLCTPFERTRYIRNITLWFEKETKTNVYMMEAALEALKDLPNLRNLTLVVDRILNHRITQNAYHSHYFGKKTCRELMAAGGVNVRLRSVMLERWDFDFYEPSHQSSAATFPLWKAEIQDQELAYRGQRALGPAEE